MYSSTYKLQPPNINFYGTAVADLDDKLEPGHGWWSRYWPQGGASAAAAAATATSVAS